MHPNLSGHLALDEGGRPNCRVSGIVWKLLGREKRSKRERAAGPDEAQPWEKVEGGRQGGREVPLRAGRHPPFSHLCRREAQRQAQERLFVRVCFIHAWVYLSARPACYVWVCLLHSWWKFASPQCYSNLRQFQLTRVFTLEMTMLIGYKVSRWQQVCCLHVSNTVNGISVGFV